MLIILKWSFLNREIKMKINRNNIWSNLAVVVVILSCYIGVINKKGWKDDRTVIASDVVLYYNYLPATFIYDDIYLEYYDSHPELGKYNWTFKISEDKRLIKMSYGLSVLYSPFFFGAHLYAQNSDYEANGYSKPYKFTMSFAALIYMLLGLFMLRSLLRKYFSDIISALVLLAVVLGTNLYYYTCFEPGMSHPYNFFLIIAFIFLTRKWYNEQKLFTTILLGITAGLITLIRPTNTLFLLFFLLWDIHNITDLKKRFQNLLSRWWHLLIMAVLIILIWVPQFIYWHLITGQWFYYSYSGGNERFFFDNPQIWNVLFSFKKGWLVYTPIMILALAGIPLMYRRLRSFFWPTAIFLPLIIYILSSWWSWWFGGSFGQRSYIDFYGLLAFPLATLIGYSLQRKIIRIVIPALVFVFIAYNLFQTSQYRHNSIHWLWMNKEAYKETFLQIHTTARYFDLLTKPDDDLARYGIYDELTSEEYQQRQQLKTQIRELNHILEHHPGFVNAEQKKYSPVEKFRLNAEKISLYKKRKDSLVEIYADSICSDSMNIEQLNKQAKEQKVKTSELCLKKAEDIFRQNYLHRKH